jgi:cell division protein FtsN
MARDYKARKRKGTGSAGWLGFGVGLSLGLVVAVVIWIRDHRSDAPTPPPPAKAAKKKGRGTEPQDAGGGDAPVPDAPPKTYDFYNMLPKFEVIVPEKDRDVKPDTRSGPETRRGTYVLQVGTYKDFADADRERAQLALQGVESYVEKVSVNSSTWLRIRIGPVKNLDELNRLRQLLRKADLDVLVIRVGD